MPRLPGRSTPPISAGPAAGSPRPLPTRGRRTLRDSLPSPAGAQRRTLGALVGVVLTVWLVAVFGRALADSNALDQRQAQESATNSGLAAQVAAGSAEIAFIQTDQFLQFEARTFGMGSSRERAFALEPDAPSPRPITPLGSAEVPPSATTPLDDWLRLLFGG